MQTTLGGEKLVVEFDIIKTIPRDYGYEEKYLAFRGSEIPYKAIIKNNAFVAIVSRKYQLIENEKVIEICKEIAKKYNLEMEAMEEFPRVHVYLRRPEQKDGVFVHNSVDESLALRVDYAIEFSNAKAIIRDNEVAQVYRKHIGQVKVTIDNLEQMINEIFNQSERLKAVIEELGKVILKDHLNLLDILEEILPKKYIVVALMMAKENPSMSFKDLYEWIAVKIWNSKNTMKRKMQLFRKLNNIMFLSVVAK